MPLLNEDTEEPLRDVVRALGGLQKVGAMLRPNMDPLAAGRWLGDCLNREKREKLDFRQVVLIMRAAREAGCHVAMQYIARECGYAEPVPVSTAHRLAEIERDFNATLQQQQHLAARMERLLESLRDGVQA